MTDIVERLRDQGKDAFAKQYSLGMYKLCDEAAAEIERLRSDAADLQQTFDLQWEADMRAVKRWREAHPGNDLVLPDRASMVVWLLEQHDAHAQRAPTPEQIDAALNAWFKSPPSETDQGLERSMKAALIAAYAVTSTFGAAPAQGAPTREQIARVIAGKIACEQDCASDPSGCGCSDDAADAVMVLYSPALTSTECGDK